MKICTRPYPAFPITVTFHKKSENIIWWDMTNFQYMIAVPRDPLIGEMVGLPHCFIACVAPIPVEQAGCLVCLGRMMVARI